MARKQIKGKAKQGAGQAKQGESLTPHPNTNKTKTETGRPMVMGEYGCLKEFLPRPITQSFLEGIARQLVEWADKKDSLHIVDFYHEKGMPKSTFYEWVEKDPVLKAAHAYALEALGARRETGAITRKYDTGAVWRRQYQFGSEYKEAMVFAAMLAKKEDESAGNKKIDVFMTDMRTLAEMAKKNEGNGDEDKKF